MHRIYIIFSIFMFFSVLGGGAYYYYHTTQNTLEKLIIEKEHLIANNTQLESGIITANETVDYLQQSYDDIKNDYDAAIVELQEIRKDNTLLRDKLSKHELSNLAATKPKLVEGIVNNATNNTNRCFEILSGASLNEKERNAKNGNEFNSECPWLFGNTFN